MKMRTLTAAATLAIGLQQPANSQVIVDMALVTCKQYLTMEADQAEVLGAWMGGYFSASKDLNVVDLRYVDRNLKKLSSYCKSRKNETLMNAIQKTAR